MFTLAKKCKVMAKKKYDPRGDIRKQKIYEIIRNNFITNPKGIRPQDIAILMKILNRIKISRTTVHAHLRKLTGENKIMAKKGRYVPRDLVDVVVFDGWALFESYIENNSPLLLRDRKFDSSPGYEYIPIDIYRNQIDDSKKLEQFIFEFANRIGAVMTCLFIEFLTPRRNVMPGPIRDNIIERIMREVIPHMSYLWEFLSMLPVNETEKSDFEIKECTLKMVYDAYKNVYPHFYRFLDEGYMKFAETALLLNNDKNNNCDHKWNKFYVHKLGEFQECQKCNICVRSGQ